MLAPPQIELHLLATLAELEREIEIMSKVSAVKCVVVGNGGVGKTSLIMTCVYAFPTEYVPSVADADPISLTIDGRPVILTTWDTLGNTVCYYC